MKAQPNLNYLKKELFNALTKHYLPKSLALKFNRSKARIVEILIALKKEKKINNFRVKSQDYWVRNVSKDWFSDKKQ